MKKIELEMKKVSYVDENGEQKTFNSFKTFTKKGKVDVRFTKSCNEVSVIPEKSCVIEVLEDNLIVDERQKFTIIWVDKIESITEYTKTDKVNKYFD